MLSGPSEVIGVVQGRPGSSGVILGRGGLGLVVVVGGHWGCR